MNSLAHETSPYLLQHQNNPVEWYPWGPQALARAKQEDKPIFLSIGYSACHWCHVMEHESFEDQRIAALMNEHFVNIKVDREERPDLDAVYMAAVQIMTGRGGWPMSLHRSLRSAQLFYKNGHRQDGKYQEGYSNQESRDGLGSIQIRKSLPRQDLLDPAPDRV